MLKPCPTCQRLMPEQYEACPSCRAASERWAACVTRPPQDERPAA